LKINNFELPTMSKNLGKNRFGRQFLATKYIKTGRKVGRKPSKCEQRGVRINNDFVTRQHKAMRVKIIVFVIGKYKGLSTDAKLIAVGLLLCVKINCDKVEQSMQIL
jgi:hypothetical protein